MTKRVLRPFTGTDGQTYQRRGDIRLGDWFEFLNAELTVLEQFAWIAFFMGWTDKKPSELSAEDRVKLADGLPYTTDQYAAIENAIIKDIKQPATPLENGAESGPVPNTAG